MASIGVIGAGTWGTALAVLLHNNGHQTAIWSALPEEIEEMTKTRRHKICRKLRFRKRFFSLRI